jgi:hypothetical protein
VLAAKHSRHDKAIFSKIFLAIGCILIIVAM